MKARITKTLLLLSVIALSGCLSTNPDKAQRAISRWIPPGTPQEDAIRIMQKHGFKCAPETLNPHLRSHRQLLQRGETVLSCERETKIIKNTWWLEVHCENGKVISISGVATGNSFFDFLIGDPGPKP